MRLREAHVGPDGRRPGGRPWRAAPAGAARGGWALVVLALALTVLGGCAQSPPDTPATRAARSQALIEAGNEAFTRGDYRLAVQRYAAATAVRKDDPAAYYGMGMALSKLGRDEEARANYARARELAQGKP
jgi:Flp pilus assembly protein TadD